MYAPLSVPIPTFARRLIPAILIAGAATLGSSAVGNPAIACAEPAVNWDKQYYQTCKQANLDDFTAGTTNIDQYRERVQYCCYKAGGGWKATTGDPMTGITSGPPPSIEGGECGDPPPFAVPRPQFNEDLLPPPPPPEAPPTDVPMVP